MYSKPKITVFFKFQENIGSIKFKYCFNGIKPTIDVLEWGISEMLKLFPLATRDMIIIHYMETNTEEICLGVDAGINRETAKWYMEKDECKDWKFAEQSRMQFYCCMRCKKKGEHCECPKEVL
jgi:hypothetical protein